ncbi:DUF397 domain-containing protein [Sphaerisporangium aureirubrum]
MGVPIAPPTVWRKSSYSLLNGECVEVRFIGRGHVCIRDSKVPAGPFLMCASGDWTALVRAVQDGVWQ